MNRKILFVDDDITILTIHRINFSSKFETLYAKSGEEGIEILKEALPVAAVVSDYSMPEMDGITFLTKVREISKDTVRIMLTGVADVQLAVNAVNEGNIFRFLTKPCPPDFLIKTLESAVEQYQLITAERELLDHTLKGTIKILIDILSVVNPIAFNKAGRLRNIIKDLGKNLENSLKWKLEIAALLSQIGCITLPTEILEKHNNSIALTPEEEKLFLSHPQIGKSLLANIPRLEEIAEAIAFQDRVYPKKISDEQRDHDIAVIAKLLKHAVDLDKTVEEEKRKPAQRKESATISQDIQTKVQEPGYSSFEKRYIIRDLPVKSLRPGMILVKDLVDKNGVPIVVKGTEISEVLILRLTNFISLNRISDPISVFILKV
jgi:response regulator RpfG family c-di-GMP phosphodiesterase